MRPSSEMKGSTMQSPHDPDATYRKKENGAKVQEITGFSSNITENCTPGELKLILDVQTEKASHADNNFFQTAIERSTEILGQMPEAASADGAYNSPENLEFIKRFAMAWYLTAIQGRTGNFKFAWDETNPEQLIVTDCTTNEIYLAKKVKRRDGKKEARYKIKIAKKNYRYFTLSDIENYFRREEINQLPKEIRNIRPNVEATIRQVFCTLDSKKTKYRGLLQNRQFVVLRCFWANFRRIADKEQQKGFWKPVFACLDEKLTSFKLYA